MPNFLAISGRLDDLVDGDLLSILSRIRLRSHSTRAQPLAPASRISRSKGSVKDRRGVAAPEESEIALPNAVA